MKILLFVMIAFLISCASSTSLKPANSPDNSLKVMEKADLDERKEVVAEEIRSAILVQSETSTIALASADDPFFQQLKRNESVQVKRPAKALTEYVSMEIWTVQLASFTDETNATKLKTELDQNYKFPVRISTENGIYKVRMGAYEHRNEADQLVYDLK
ncbi:MAG: SPOR domain-containing protein, partial [Calditrichaeota bacterium]|nr:SPOR domain-containing protein [Calditrichota bacterium]